MNPEIARQIEWREARVSTTAVDRHHRTARRFFSRRQVRTGQVRTEGR